MLPNTNIRRCRALQTAFSFQHLSIGLGFREIPALGFAPGRPDGSGTKERQNMSSVCQVLHLVGADWTIDAGMGSRARAAWERLALVSPVETITPHLPVFVTLLFSALAAVPC